MTELLRESKYAVRRRAFRFWGQPGVYDLLGRLALQVQRRRAGLKDDIRLCTPDGTEIAAIRTRPKLGLFPGYDVTDADGKLICAFTIKTARSILREEWAILDDEGRETGVVMESSTALALLRRVSSEWVPKRFAIEIDGLRTCEIRRAVNPFGRKVTVDFSTDDMGSMDRRVAIAAAFLVWAG